jgi:hypothetical protein
MGLDGDAANAAGVSLALCCSILNATGLALQKRAHRQLEGTGRKYYREKQWLIGIVCMAIASVASLANFGLLGQARASAFASLTLINNAILAHFLLKEKFTKWDAASTGTVAAGITTSIVFGSSGVSSQTNSLDDIVNLLHRDEVYYAAPVFAALFIGCELYVRWMRRLRKAGTKKNWQARIECFCRALFAGLCSGTTGLTAKCIVVSCQSMVTTHSAETLKRFEFWLMLFALPLSLVLQLRSLNGGLRYFPALELIPIYQASIVIVGVSFGWVFYAEDDSLPTLNAVIFAVGCGISVLGIALMGFKPQPQASTDDKNAAADRKGSSATETSNLLSSLGDANFDDARVKLLSGSGSRDSSRSSSVSGSHGHGHTQGRKGGSSADDAGVGDRFESAVPAAALVDAIGVVAPNFAHALVDDEKPLSSAIGDATTNVLGKVSAAISHHTHHGGSTANLLVTSASTAGSASASASVAIPVSSVAERSPILGSSAVPPSPPSHLNLRYGAT